MMAAFNKIQKPIKTNLLICFGDLYRFIDVANKMNDALELFELLNGMAATIIRHISSTTGRVIKFIGDSVLIVFPEDSVDEGMLLLLEMRDKVAAYFSSRDIDMKMHIGVHFGEAAIGPFGEDPVRSIDVIGEPVSRAAVLAGREYRGKFVITPQVFRKLMPETRKRFHKYTPPVVYVAE
jgi:class 3 adenylate cyclase